MFLRKKQKHSMWHNLESIRWILWHPTPVLLPGKSHGRRSLVGCRPRGREESDTTEWLHFHFSLSCIGEGNGNLLQCSCLENPRHRGAWWAAVYGVAQSQTWLRRFSRSSQDICLENPMDRGAWWAAVHGVAKSQTRLRTFTFKKRNTSGIL